MDIQTTVALRDWAVAVEALGKGSQVLVMRKGGIHEETRHFEVQSDQFFLFPAYEHQKEILLKPPYREGIAESLRNWTPQQTTVTVNYFAQLVEDIPVLDEDKIVQLAPYHIWTNDFATVRLKWKKKLPLHVLLLKVYQLDEPIQVPMKEEYSGCKSWLQLPDECSGISGEPVLSEVELQSQINKIKEILV